MANLDLAGLSKHYGDFYAVRDVTLSIKDGEFVVLLGPSGCGKTTTLRMVAGFIEPTAGHVKLAGSDVTVLPPWKRNAGMVFQSYALFPHLNVAQNVAFGLEMRKLAKADIERRVEETLALVRLGGYGARLPRQLSGGQQQRVALARALAIRPGIVAGALFGFVTSFGNLEMSLFLVGPGRTTLPIVILQYLEWKIDPTIAAVSVVQILLIGGAMLLTDRYVKLARVV